MLDVEDRRLLRFLQSEPDLSGPDLAALAGMSAGKVARRLERMAGAGIMRGRHAVIDWHALGYEVTVSLRVTLDKTNPRAFDDFLAAARDLREVIEIQTFLGRVDVRLSVIARDMADYQRLYREHVLALPHIADIEALVTVATLKDERALPL